MRPEAAGHRPSCTKRRPGTRRSVKSYTTDTESPLSHGRPSTASYAVLGSFRRGTRSGRTRYGGRRQGVRRHRREKGPPRLAETEPQRIGEADEIIASFKMRTGRTAPEACRGFRLLRSNRAASIPLPADGRAGNAAAKRQRRRKTADRGEGGGRFGGEGTRRRDGVQTARTYREKTGDPGCSKEIGEIFISLTAPQILRLGKKASKLAFFLSAYSYL